VIQILKKYFQSKKKLKEANGHLNHQIRLMQDHIAAQNNEKLMLKRDIFELEKKINQIEMLLDIERNTKRY
jgi:hypothetical protein